ncbi:MAG: hypothetical protein HC824_20045 [Synechococcales cyanobacterium RM1_1_8]|nr:hypothetical protein [Synechococcales cyanobacterium RM1_1_8]
MQLKGKLPLQSSSQSRGQASPQPGVIPPDGDRPVLTLPSPDANPCQCLGDYLQQRWEQEVGYSTLQIHCAQIPSAQIPSAQIPSAQIPSAPPSSASPSPALRREQFLVVVEHAITEQPPVAPTFQRLIALLEEAPECLWLDWLGEDEDSPEIVQGRFFLRVLGQARAYVEQPGSINLMAGVAPGMVPLTATLAAEAVGAKAQTFLETETQAQSAASGSSHFPTPPAPAESAAPLGHPAASAPAPERQPDSPDWSESSQPATAPAEAGAIPGQGPEPLGAAANAPQDLQYPGREAPLEQTPLHIPKAIWAGGLGLCLAMFLGSFYIASRPCLLRDCPALMLAERQGQEATERLQTANSLDDIDRSRQQLQAALKQLRQVPGWSSYGAEARGARSRYRKLVEALTPVEEALAQADQAEEKTQLGTAKPERWQEISAHWEAAIAHLQGVAPSNPLYALAQDKLKQYEALKLQAQTSLENEEAGQRLLQEARGYIAAAPARSEGSAGGEEDDALAALQRSESRLEDAIFTLKKVPRNTTAYQESVRLLASYQAELAMNQGKQSREAFIVNSYREALLYAEDAKRAEGDSNWQKAKEDWQTALGRIDQIPTSSTYFTKAQSLVTEYTYALQAAEQRAQEDLALNQLRGELDSLCAGSPRVCTHEISPSSIRVRLTLDYERAVLTAGAVGDEDSRTGALRHVQELESALESFSNAAQIPLELYDPDGVLVGTHQPRQGYGSQGYGSQGYGSQAYGTLGEL